jgi:1-deoxy-D-xylulose-5-phosphate synthase
LEAAERLAVEGIEVEVVNARFLKPLDERRLVGAITSHPWVITVEEAALTGGFGSALLEAAASHGVDASRVRCLGIPDRFIEHGTREDCLAMAGLDAVSIRSRISDWWMQHAGAPALAQGGGRHGV